MRGRKLPRRVKEKLCRINRGKKLSTEQREKIRAALKRIGHHPPGVKLWTPAENEIVRTVAPAVAAKKTGRTLQAMFDRRRTLGLPDEGRRGN
jgi:hypothetical protein